MIILGIDPGLAAVGWAVLKKEGPELIDYDCIRTEKGKDFSQRLDLIFDKVRGVAARTKPQAAAVEELFFAKNMKTAIKVAQVMGVIKLACRRSGLSVFEYTPLNIKMTIAGYGRADKKQVGRMVSKLLHLKKEIKPHHAADAAAVALTHLFTNHRLKA